MGGQTVTLLLHILAVGAAAQQGQTVRQERGRHVGQISSSGGASFIQASSRRSSTQIKRQLQLRNRTQSVHWVFTTDCSAYMFNEGNLMLASAYETKVPGKFTWVTYGCERPEQKEAFKKLGHPEAQVWHQPSVELKDPKTGQPYKHFQASNRPVSIEAWRRATEPVEDAIAIVDPDMIWLRPVHLVQHPQASTKTSSGAWQFQAPSPKHGSGARYGQGCVPNRWSDDVMLQICSGEQNCVKTKNDNQNCDTAYSSGPPWILHRSDAEDIFGSWMDTAVKVHEQWPDMLAEQVSYGVTQMEHHVDNTLDPYWFLSAAGAGEQPWQAVAAAEYDPCEARAPPPSDMALPPLWHSCSTYEIPHLKDQGYRLHKDHIHKDILDCGAPLLRHPPTDALKRYAENKMGQDFQETWSVCTYTNLVNHYATSWKQRYCEQPNLERTFAYPPHAQGFLNESSWLQKTFRKGGWTDVDYKVSGH